MAHDDDRLKQEIQFHLEQQIAKNIRAGMEPGAARREALLRFGGVEGTREAARQERRWTWAADFVRDLRLSARALKRTPAFAFATVTTLALGIAAAAAMFSVVNGVLLTPLPYPDSDRIVRLYQLGPTGSRGNVSGPNFTDWRNGTRAFAEMAAMQQYGKMSVTGLGEPRRATVVRISSRFFPTFGAAPNQGRDFSAAEYAERLPQSAIISASLAEQAGGASAIGRNLTLDGLSILVVGIMPREFDYPVGTDIWLPLDEREAAASARSAGNYQAVARVRAGTDIGVARREMTVLARDLKARYGDDNPAFGVEVRPILDVMTARSKTSLQMLLGAAVLLLAVAIVNVSNMLVARGLGRRREFSLQLALGAGRARLARQVLAETFTLCALGGAIGIGLAAAAVRLFTSLAPAGTPRVDAISVDWQTAGIAGAVAVAIAVVLSAITVAAVRSTNLAPALSEESRGGSAGRRPMRLREGLIVVEVALTLVLLAGAGLLARTLATVLAIDPGFRTDDALVIDIDMSAGDGPDAMSRRVNLQTSLVDRLRRLPGVAQAGMINAFPIGPGGADGTFVEMTRSDEFTSYGQMRALGAGIKARQGYAAYRLANADYFTAMGIPLIRGRYLEDGDGPGAPQVAVISESLAKSKWPGQDPIGRYVQFGNMDGDLTGIRIVGIVGDVREVTIEAPAGPALYASIRQRPRQAGSASIVLRGPRPEAIAETARRVVREVAPDVPAEVRTIESALESVTGPRRFNFWLIGAFAVSALVLASVGVYGLVAFSVEQRLREMGIRMALGARPAALAGMIVRRGVVLASIGAAAGLAAALAMTNIVDAMLFGVTATDPAVHATVVAVLIAATAAASYLPARRILRQSPLAALKVD